MASSSLHLFLLFLALISLQTRARESQFFSMTSRYATSPKVSTSIPEEPTRTTVPPLSPQSHTGYGLYGHDPNQFPTTSTSTSTTTSNVARYEPNTIPSTFTSAEFENKEFNANNNNNPSSEFTYDTEFWDENYKNKEFNANNEMNANDNSVPSGFLNQGNSYPIYEKQYGMSDTRVMEHGKYFYDVNAEEEGNSKGHEEYRRNGRNGGYNYGSGYGYKNNEVVENQKEYVP